MKIIYKKHKKTTQNIFYILIILILGIFGWLLIKDKKLSIKENNHVSHNIENTPEGLREVRDKFINLLDPNDHNSIFKVVDAIQADKDISYRCHEIAHDIGHKAYTYYGFSDAMTFNNPEHVKHALVQYICAGGYMHGILEQMSLQDPDFLKEPERVCGIVPDENRASCFHGIGHVQMYANNRDVEKSIIGCRVIKLKNDMYRCFEGVRMEQFWGTTVANEDLGWDLEKPLSSCENIAEDEKPTCFLYSTFGYLRIHNKDYGGAANMCISSGLSDSDSQFCLKGLGMTMMSKFKGKNMEGSEIYVDGFSDKNKMAFYEGVIGYARLSGVSEIELKVSCLLLKNDTKLCEQALIDYKP